MSYLQKVEHLNDLQSVPLIIRRLNQICKNSDTALGVKASLTPVQLVSASELCASCIAPSEFHPREAHTNAPGTQRWPPAHLNLTAIHKSHHTLPQGHMDILLTSASQSVPFQMPHLSCLTGTGQPMPVLLLLLWSPRPASLFISAVCLLPLAE